MHVKLEIHYDVERERPDETEEDLAATRKVVEDAVSDLGEAIRTVATSHGLDVTVKHR